MGSRDVGVEKKLREVKAGSKAKLTADSCSFSSEKEAPDRCSNVNTRMRLIKLKWLIITSGNCFINIHLSYKQN